MIVGIFRRHIVTTVDNLNVTPIVSFDAQFNRDSSETGDLVTVPVMLPRISRRKSANAHSGQSMLWSTGRSKAQAVATFIV